MTALEAGLLESDVKTTWAESVSYALSMLAERDFDLVVTDEDLGDMTGLEFIKTVITQKPMVNCAAISSLSPDDFHVASEGLGVLMQLPVNPGYEYAEILLKRLEKIMRFAVGTG